MPSPIAGVRIRGPLPNFRSYILGIIHGISGLISPPGPQIREENLSMIETTKKLAYGVAILVPSFLPTVPLRAEDASHVPSGVVSNPYGAVLPSAKSPSRTGFPSASR